MIAIIQSLPVGNALRLWLQPPAPAARIRLLRKDADTFTGQDDPDAYVVMDGIERVITDFSGLIDGVAVFYRAFYWIAGAWVASASKPAVPNTAYIAKVIDPQSIVRDRLELGLAAYVRGGTLSNPRGFIPVLTASPQFEDAPFPLVTCHLTGDAPDVRALGEEVGSEFFSEVDGLWHSFEGSLSRTDLTIVAWSQNADERILLRNCMKAVILANLSVFDAAGLLQVTYSIADQDDFETYATPMFQAVCQFSCSALVAVEDTAPALRDISAFRTN